MDPANQQDDDCESTSYASSFETHHANQPTEFPNLDTLMIEKIFRSVELAPLLVRVSMARYFFMSHPRQLHTAPCSKKAHLWCKAMIP